MACRDREQQLTRRSESSFWQSYAQTTNSNVCKLRRARILTFAHSLLAAIAFPQRIFSSLLGKQLDNGLLTESIGTSVGYPWCGDQHPMKGKVWDDNGRHHRA